MATRAQLMEAVMYAKANEWKPINYNTLRRTWTVVTPAIHRSKGPGDTFGKWADDTFDRHLFVTIVGRADGKGVTSVAVGNARAPWMGRQDAGVTIKEAIRVLTATYDDEGNAV